MNFVYLTTNLTNGKQYVGAHNGEINDAYLGSGNILYHAIIKYGRKNFKREILEICDTPEESFKLEEKYIKKYNTLSPNGYNISPYGGNLPGSKLNEETKKKISDTRKRKNIKPTKKALEAAHKASKGRVQTEEEKEKRRKASLKWHKEKGFSEKNIEKMSNKRKEAWEDKEYREKISSSLRGHKISVETRKKISESLKRRNNEQKKISNNRSNSGS